MYKQNDLHLETMLNICTEDLSDVTNFLGISPNFMSHADWTVRKNVKK